MTSEPSPHHPKSSVRLPQWVKVLVVSWIIFALVAGSDAGTHFFSFIVLFFGGGLWWIVWMIRMVKGRGSVPPFSRRDALIYWGVEPVVYFVSATLWISGLLMQARFFLSKSALEKYATDVAAGRVVAQRFRYPQRWVGLFHVRETELLESGVVRVITSDDGFIDAAGFAYAPTVPISEDGDEIYLHIVGRWYHWKWRF